MWGVFVTFLFTTAFYSFFLYREKLLFNERLEEILKEIEDDYNSELSDKRTFRKHRDKLKEERDELLSLLNFIKE